MKSILLELYKNNDIPSTPQGVIFKNQPYNLISAFSNLFGVKV